MRTLPIHLFIFLVCLIAIQCKKEDKTPKNVAPVATAGFDRAFTLTGVESSDTIVLNGSATDADGNVVTYLWNEVSGPNTATLQTPNSASTVVRKMIAGTYQFQLTATDDKGARGTDTVAVTVSNPKINVPPVVTAGNDRSIILSGVASADTIVLKGSAQDSDGQVVATIWSVISGPNVAGIQRPDSTATVVQNLVAGTYLFQLAAIDEKGAKGTDTVAVIVKNNTPPVVTAGINRTITLTGVASADTVVLKGSATDADGRVVDYFWSEVSGPNVAAIQSPEATTTVISNLVAGTYVFKLRAVDDKGASASSNVTITVNPVVVVIRELLLRPGPSESQCTIVAWRDGPDGHPYQTRNTNINSNPDINASYWTYNSEGLGDGTNRTYLNFTGLSAIPTNAVIVSAKLSLYGLNPGTAVAAPQGNYGSNATYLKRVTGNWSASTITWNNKPGTTDANQVPVPASNALWSYNVVDLDVTNLVKDMVSANQIYGFCLQLQSEQLYRNISFGSSKSTDPNIRPKLVVVYK